MKLVAGMLGAPLNEIARREAHRRQRRLTIVAAIAIVGMLVMTGLATLAWQARNEARHQREQAEALVGFMLGDLRTRLEPVGRLDVLDAVGSRVLGYYQGQDSGDLSDEALAQRTRALTLIGEIANRRGDLDGALTRYREALAGTEEALRRAPNDAQRIFDHAQNVFWVASIGWQRGQARRAEARLPRLSRTGPPAARDRSPTSRNGGWRRFMPTTISAFCSTRRAPTARPNRPLPRCLAATEQLRASAPRNATYRDMEAEALAYLADAREQGGRLEEAIAARERQIRILDAAAATDSGDIAIRERSLTSRRALGRLFASAAILETALRYLREAAAAGAKRCVSASRQIWNGCNSRQRSATDLGELLLLARRTEEAGPAIRVRLRRSATIDRPRRERSGLAERDAQLPDPARPAGRGAGLSRRSAGAARRAAAMNAPAAAGCPPPIAAMRSPTPACWRASTGEPQRSRRRSAGLASRRSPLCQAEPKRRRIAPFASPSAPARPDGGGGGDRAMAGSNRLPPPGYTGEQSKLGRTQ